MSAFFLPSLTHLQSILCAACDGCRDSDVIVRLCALMLNANLATPRPKDVLPRDSDNLIVDVAKMNRCFTADFSSISQKIKTRTTP